MLHVDIEHALEQPRPADLALVWLAEAAGVHRIARWTWPTSASTASASAGACLEMALLA